MGYKKPSYMCQTWWVIKYAVKSWIEWQDMKRWAKEYYPAWLEMAIKGNDAETRQHYKLKIMNAYNEAEC